MYALTRISQILDLYYLLNHSEVMRDVVYGYLYFDLHKFLNCKTMPRGSELKQTIQYSQEY